MGNLNQKCQSSKYCLLAGAYQTHVVVSDQNMEQFKGKDITFVSKWLTEKGLIKLCSVDE